MRLKLAILASGSGSNAEAIIKAAQDGFLDAEISLVFTNKENAGVIERVKKLNVPCEVLAHKDYASREDYDKAVVAILQKYEVDTIAMAGYMRLVTSEFISAYKGRILNVHPALLPSFKGAQGIEDAKDYGVKIFGCTVHFVDEIMDNGAIIIQAAMPTTFQVFEKTVDKLHSFEHKIYVQALRWLAEDRLEIDSENPRIVHLKEKENINYQNPFIDCIVYPPLEK